MTRAAELVDQTLDAFQIEPPSWGVADTGIRFAKFRQDTAARMLTEELTDARQIPTPDSGEVPQRSIDAIIPPPGSWKFRTVDPLQCLAPCLASPLTVLFPSFYNGKQQTSLKGICDLVREGLYADREASYGRTQE